MYSVLYDHGKIPDPFFGLNEQAVKQLSGEDCSFTAKFTADEALLRRDYAERENPGLRKKYAQNLCL